MNRDERFPSVRSAYLDGGMGLVEARLSIGSASWKERWAYRYPRLLGRLSPGAAEERLTGVHPHTRLLSQTLANLDVLHAAIREDIAQMTRQIHQGPPSL